MVVGRIYAANAYLSLELYAVLKGYQAVLGKHVIEFGRIYKNTQRHVMGAYYIRSTGCVHGLTLRSSQLFVDLGHVRTAHQADEVLGLELVEQVRPRGRVDRLRGRKTRKKNTNERGELTCLGSVTVPSTSNKQIVFLRSMVKTNGAGVFYSFRPGGVVTTVVRTQQSRPVIMNVSNRCTADVVSRHRFRPVRCVRRPDCGVMVSAHSTTI